MNNYGIEQMFLYDKDRESIDDYLSRAAVWIDIIERGSKEEREALHMQGFQESGFDEVKNYVFGIMNPVLERMALSTYKRYVNESQRDVFINEFRIEVWKAFPLFNNPKYKKIDRPYRITTFALPYLKQTSWKVQIYEHGIHDYTYRNCLRVKDAVRKISLEQCKDPDAVTNEEVSSYLNDRNINISTEDVHALRNLIAPRTEVPETIAAEDTIDSIDIDKDDRVERLLREFLSTKHSLQKFVFLQNFGFCSENYKYLTIEQLVKDPLFLNLCRSDMKARRKIVSKRTYLGNAAAKEAALDSTDGYIHMKEKYIYYMRDLMKNDFQIFIEENAITPQELKDVLSDVMFAAWDEIVLLYELDIK